METNSNRRTIIQSGLVGLLSAVVLPKVASSAEVRPTNVKVTAYPIPPVSPDMVGMAVAPDDSIWWCEAGFGRIGRRTADGVITHFQIPDRPYGIEQLAFGPDGAFWFTNFNGDKIGRITLDGQITQFKTPAPVIDNRAKFREIEGPKNAQAWFGKDSMPIASNSPMCIVRGPDNAMWYTELMAGRVGRVTMEGKFKRWDLPTPLGGPTALQFGTDGNLWIAYWYAPKVVRMSPAGKFTEFEVPLEKGDVISSLLARPNGEMWFTQPRAARIGKMTSDGQLSWLPLAGSEGRFPLGIFAAPDGAIWFNEMFGSDLGRINEDGTITRYPLGPGIVPFGAVFDSKGVLWVGDKVRGQLLRVDIT